MPILKRTAKSRHPRIVLIGGGSGCATLYPAILKATPEATAIIGMSDSGGSTGEISAQLDILPVGDLRNVMLAASANPTIREMSAHRYGGDGSLKGHAWGNMAIAACIEEYGVSKGIEKAAEILQVKGRILPVTLQQNQLVMRDGKKVIHGEHQIDVHETVDPEPDVWLEPAIGINPEARRAIKEADLIVISAGSVYTSLLAALIPEGVREALRDSRAPKVLVTNLVTEAHQTDGWHAVDYAKVLMRHYIPLDYVLYNTLQPTDAMLANYAEENEHPVDISPDRFKELGDVKCIGAALLSTTGRERNPNDPIKRALIRHDPQAVRRELWKLLPKSLLQ